MTNSSVRKIRRRQVAKGKKSGGEDSPAPSHEAGPRKIRRRSRALRREGKKFLRSLNSAQIFQRNIEAFDLRCEGRSYAEIGDHFGVHPKTAFNYCKAAMKAIAKFCEEDNRHIIKTEVTRMDKLLHGMWDAATKGYYGYDRKGNKVKYPPSPKHADAVMKIMKRKAELLGLDEAKKIQVGNDPENPIQDMSAVEARLVDSLTRLAAKVPSACQLPESETTALEELVPIKSTNIKKAGYNPETEVLTILFKTGKKYEYLDVPQKVFDEFLEAKSQGTYFHKEIRQSYEFMKAN